MSSNVSGKRQFQIGFGAVTALACVCLLLVCPALRGDEPVLSRIAFGSCAKQDQPQPIWEAIRQGRPELMILLGDNIYGDTDDMDVLRGKYRQLRDQPGFAALRRDCSIVATWDDHDYGQDDGGASYRMRRESQQVFLDFIEVAVDDTRRQQEGIYWSHVYGPPGQRIQVILLDTRYFRSPLKQGFAVREPGEGYRGKYIPNTDAGVTILGETQWKWLEEQLRVPAELRVIGSSFQVLSDQHGWEMWGNFPQERQRLLTLLRTTAANGVVLNSGDRHLAELAALDERGEESIGYPLFEVTSSSLNQPSGNRTGAGTRFANEINPYRIGLTYFDTNYGNILVDWAEADPVIRLQICDERGTVVVQQRLRLSQLRPR